MTGILLRLGGDGAGIVGHQDDQAALHADIFQAHERIGSHVQAHLLHGDQRTGACVGGAAGHFHGDLLIHGPFHVDIPAAALRHGLQHLGGRGAGITADQVHAGREGAERDGLIAHYKFIMHTVTSLRVQT